MEIIERIRNNIEAIKMKNNDVGVRLDEIIEEIESAQVNDMAKEKILYKIEGITEKILSYGISVDEFQKINDFLRNFLKSEKEKNGGVIIRKTTFPHILVDFVRGLHFKFKNKNGYNTVERADLEQKKLDCELPPENVLKDIYYDHYKFARNKGYPISDYVRANQSCDVIPYILTNKFQSGNNTLEGLQCEVIHPSFGNKDYLYPTSEDISICPSISPRAMEICEIVTKNTDENTKYIPSPTDIVDLSDQQKETLIPLNIRGLIGQYFYDEYNNSIYRKVKTRPKGCRLSDDKWYHSQSEIYTKVDLIPYEKKQYDGKVMWVAIQPVVSGIPYIPAEIYAQKRNKNELLSKINEYTKRPVAINYLNSVFLREVKELADICREKKIFGDSLDSVQTWNTDVKPTVTLTDNRRPPDDER